jgi:hypothetical protein
VLATCAVTGDDLVRDGHPATLRNRVRPACRVA